MATITLNTDIDLSLTQLELLAGRSTRTGILIAATFTPEQIADAFLALTAQEKAELFNYLANKSFSLPQGGWDSAVDELLRVGVTPDALDVIQAPASHPLHAIRPGDSVRVNVNCENAATRVVMVPNTIAIVERLDRTGKRVIFSNGIALDYVHVTKL